MVSASSGAFDLRSKGAWPPDRLRWAMGKVKCQISISADGYLAGPNQSEEHPLGEGGEALHEWVVKLAAWRSRTAGRAARSTPATTIVEEASGGTGAVVMGRNMFGPVRGPWTEPLWNGWWGDEPPFRVPVFVLTHDEREPLTLRRDHLPLRHRGDRARGRAGPRGRRRRGRLGRRRRRDDPAADPRRPPRRAAGQPGADDPRRRRPPARRHPAEREAGADAGGRGTRRRSPRLRAQLLSARSRAASPSARRTPPR